ncbi:MAG: glycosyltransferase family 39 protein [Candidatus Sumerlaeaceae bacterium]|nr:glycosyltransferase family 39 protein [Candidatus Sumerlaeaceae bacterium]
MIPPDNAGNAGPGAARSGGLGGLLAASGAALSFLCAATFIIWAQVAGGSNPAAAEAALTPLRSVRMLAANLAAEDLFHNWGETLRTGSWAVLVWAAWLYGVVAVGTALTPRLTTDRLPPSARIAICYCLGLLAVGLLIFFMGLLGLFTRPALGGLTVVLLLAGLAVWRRAAGLLAGFPVPGWHARRDEKGWSLAGAVLVVVFAGVFFYALTPPIQSDAMRYHLAAPQEFLKAGRIHYLPLNAFSNFPLLLQMHYAVALALGAPAAAQLMHFATMIACLLMSHGLVLATLSPQASEESAETQRAAWLATLLYAGAPASLIVGAWPFNDHAVAVFVVGTVLATLEAARRPSLPAFVLAGLMMGGALGTKYSAAAVVAAVASFGLAALGLRRRLRQSLAGILLCATAAAGTGGVWFAKNFAMTGNPVYPLAHSRFNGGEWTQTNADFYRDKMDEKGAPRTLTEWVASPVRATFAWTRYEHHLPGATVLVAFTAGFLGCAAAVARGRRRAWPVVFTTAAALAYHGIWFFTYQSNRMIPPAVALMAPAVAALLTECGRHRVWMRTLATTAVIVTLAYGWAWAMQWIYTRAMPSVPAYLLGANSREAYLSRALSYYAAFEQIGDMQARRTVSEPRADRVLLIGEHRIFYGRFNAVWSDWFDTPAVLHIIRQHGVSTAAELKRVLADRNIGIILYNEAELAAGRQMETYFKPRFTPDEWTILMDLLAMSDVDKWAIPPGVTLLRFPEARRSPRESQP